MTASADFGFDYEAHVFTDAGWCPNNPARPLLIYRQVRSEHGKALAAIFETLFRRHGWPPAWRYTIYDFAHYHSNTHEVVGAYRGHALVRFGDSAGKDLQLVAGDVVVIPAGVSHQRLSASADFIAVGAYPTGFEPDQIRKVDPTPISTDPAEVPIPPHDPLLDARGPLQKEWKEPAD